MTTGHNTRGNKNKATAVTASKYTGAAARRPEAIGAEAERRITQKSSPFSTTTAKTATRTKIKKRRLQLPFTASKRQAPASRVSEHDRQSSPEPVRKRKAIGPTSPMTEKAGIPHSPLPIPAAPPNSPQDGFPPVATILTPTLPVPAALTPPAAVNGQQVPTRPQVPLATASRSMQRRVAVEQLLHDWESRQTATWTENPDADLCQTSSNVVGYLNYSMDSVPLDILQSDQVFLTFVPL